MKQNVHIINHTHWDREWFATSIYTSQWIAGLIHKIEAIVEQNPNFCYLFDGQTLVIEDLLQQHPDYRDRIEKLVRNGNLLIGPYYCQPDWRLTAGELLIRNLQYGLADAKKLGQNQHVGWLVDTFGHISQNPQIHQIFDINAVFVWRGVPELVPYFDWEGADGQSLFTINLFGGYRNLYGVTHVPELAVERLKSESRRLSPHYPTADIPLFDGYDLEDNPEDPLSFYKANGHLPEQLNLQETSPAAFASLMQSQDIKRPTIKGELSSGKYGATFPGTFSARTYLKLMSHDCAHMLFSVAEPIASLAWIKGRPFPAQEFEQWSRLLLQNAVHDCICGVSIDEVHEKMELSYWRVFKGALEDVEKSLPFIMQDMQAGTYAISTSPYPVDQWQWFDGFLYHVKTEGVGVFPIKEQLPTGHITAEKMTSFQWENDHYSATLSADGYLVFDHGLFGRLQITEELGDTYSDEQGAVLAQIDASNFEVFHIHDEYCVVLFDAHYASEKCTITAQVQLTFDQTARIAWQVDLDSRGTDFRIELLYEPQENINTIQAGMPFDMVERPLSDSDLLPRELSDDLAKILLGQRETAIVRTYPFHDTLAIQTESSSTAIFAKGMYAYQINQQGQLAITLQRAVEWLTKSDLQYRVGDAGPFFYVPDARGERSVRHQFAFMFGTEPNAPRFQEALAAFSNPPLIIATQNTGTQSRWQFPLPPLPTSTIQTDEKQIWARVYNPSAQRMTYLDPNTGEQQILAAKAIKNLAYPIEQKHAADKPLPTVEVLGAPIWRVGKNYSRPDSQILDKLSEYIQKIEAELQALEAHNGELRGSALHYLHHRQYVLGRELLEFRLSRYLNERKRSMDSEQREGYLYSVDEETLRLSTELNHLRMKRRIYDYIAALVSP